MLPTKTLSKILREKLRIQNSHSNGHITSFDVLITTHVIRPNCRTFCWLCSSGNELKIFRRVQRRKYDTIVNIINCFGLLILRTISVTSKFKVVIVMHLSRSLRRPSLTFHIFDFFFETAEQNLTKLDNKQGLNVLYQVCLFRADRKNLMADSASDWPRHYRLLLYNRWTEFAESWRKAITRRHLQSLRFSGWSEK